jgi:hypothetical protein
MHDCSFGQSLATGKINNIKIHTISNAVPSEEKIAPALISVSPCNLCISFKKFLLLFTRGRGVRSVVRKLQNSFHTFF